MSSSIRTAPQQGAAHPTATGWLARFPVARPSTSTARAAVMIVLRDGRNDVETLLIERAVRDSDPASGHVAFPGGRTQPEDPDLVITALRELEEEVGLGPADLQGPPVFVGSDYATAFAMHVGIFAAGLGRRGSPPSVKSPREVAHVFWLPRSALESTERVTRETRVGPREVEATLYQSHVLWGFTRRILLRFFALPTPDPMNPRDPSIPHQWNERPLLE